MNGWFNADLPPSLSTTERFTCPSLGPLLGLSDWLRDMRREDAEWRSGTVLGSFGAAAAFILISQNPILTS